MSSREFTLPVRERSVTAICGAPGSGKTFLALAVAKAALKDGAKVKYFSPWEERDAIAKRLETMGILGNPNVTYDFMDLLLRKGGFGLDMLFDGENDDFVVIDGIEYFVFKEGGIRELTAKLNAYASSRKGILITFSVPTREKSAPVESVIDVGYLDAFKTMYAIESPMDASWNVRLRVVKDSYRILRGNGFSPTERNTRFIDLNVAGYMTAEREER